MFGYIYLTENLINGKKYIGKRAKSEFDTNYIGSGKLLLKAIKKYGKENFTCKILCECNSENELNQCEIDFIKAYNAVESDDFYNLALGGQGGSPLLGKKRITNGIIGKTIFPDEPLPDGFWLGVPEISAERGQHISEAKKGKESWNKGSNWYTNGEDDVIAFECPVGYQEGRTKGSCKGMHCYTNGEKNIYLTTNDVVPDGFKPGTTRNHIGNLKGKICYTNGVKHIYLFPNEVPPVGFYKGYSEERKKTCSHTNNSIAGKHLFTDGVNYKYFYTNEAPDGWVKSSHPSNKHAGDYSKRSIRCIETGQIFESIADAGRYFNTTNINKQNILNHRKIKGYTFEYLES